MTSSDTPSEAEIVELMLRVFMKKMGADGPREVLRRVLTAIRPIIEAKEREECAKIAENFRHPNPFPTVYGAIAEAIRSRPATGGAT